MFENLRLIKDEKTSEIFNANKQNKKDKKWKEKKEMNFLSVFYTDSLRDNFLCMMIKVNSIARHKYYFSESAKQIFD